MTLAAAIVLAGIAVGLSHVLIQFRRGVRSDCFVDQARVHAELGVRHAIHFTTVAPNWRQLLNNGLWLRNIAVDQATYTVGGIDQADGDLQNDIDGPILLTCTAVVHGVSRTVQVTARNPPWQLLRYAVAAGGLFNLADQVVVYGDVTSNANIDKTGSSTWIYGDAEAVGTIGDTDQITGTISPGSAPKTFADGQSIISYYQDLATPITYQPQIENILLSPTSNPFGQTNTDGLYVIDCNNERIVIKDCRIVGTLLLLNPTDNSTVEAAINWQPARPDYPALIVESLITIKPDSDLLESQVGTDFSLPGEAGNGTVFDVFPNRITGAIYSNGDLVLDKGCYVVGSVIAAGSIELKDNSSVQSVGYLYDNPPEHFRETYLACVPGTWQEVIPDN